MVLVKVLMWAFWVGPAIIHFELRGNKLFRYVDVDDALDKG